MRQADYPARARLARIGMGMVGVLFAGGCVGWRMDYGRPAAQFVAADVASKAAAFTGRKITVRGTVAKVDLSRPGSARVFLRGGIECNFGKFSGMAEGCKVGEVVYVDGFLVRCGEGGVRLDPAMRREASAPFSPR